MNNPKTVLRLLIICQLFTFFFLLFLPTLVRILEDGWGKALYAALACVTVGFGIALRYALNSVQ